ncbi:MAG: hypothetical protein NZ928_04460 [Endomicrobia bacterium]|nr:hypothetical protein [Endomicrobiia bacterium]MDW8055710.1 Holliday junction branch migration protein RuvA [Elusimicrobiota bacterium]
MFNYLIGKVVDKKIDKNICVIDVNGVGYEIVVSDTTLQEITISDKIVKFYIVEISSGLYSSGLPTLYGFLTEEEKEIFLAFKDNLSNVGPKKALEYLDKVKKNISEFKTAVRRKNYKLLTSLFGFRHSSAEKIVSTLANLDLFATESMFHSEGIDVDIYSDLVSALVNLGYKEQQVKPVVEKILTSQDASAKNKKRAEIIQELIPIVLRELSSLK